MATSRSPERHEAASGWTFASRVRALGLSVPALYVTVEDLEGFAAALAARSIPGVDARRGR